MADITVDPSQVQSISVDPSEVQAIPAEQPGFLHGVVQGSSLLSALAHPIDTFAHLTGIDEAKEAKDAWDKGDHYGAAVKALHVITSNPASRIANGIVDTSKDQAKKAIKAFHEGDYQGAIMHAGTTLVPLLASGANGADLVKQGAEEASKTPRLRQEGRSGSM